MPRGRPASDESFELVEDQPEEGNPVSDRWALTAFRLLRLAFKRRCWAHLGQYLQIFKKRGLAQ